MWKNYNVGTALLAVLGLLSLTGCERINYTMNKGYMDEIAKKPHTAHVWNYAVTFPRASEIQDEIPGGLESGTNFQAQMDFDKKHIEDKEITNVAEWAMANGGGTIQFIVKRGEPGVMCWLEPFGFQNVVRKPAGTIEVGGLKFSINHWKGNFKDAASDAKGVYGCDYEARDNDGEFIGLRGTGLGSEDATNRLTEKVLKTLKRIPPKITIRKPDMPGVNAAEEPCEMIRP